MSRPLRWLVIVIATLLALIVIAAYAIDKTWGPEATDRKIADSAQEYAQGFAAELDASTSEKQIITAAARHGVQLREIRREPGATTVFAMVVGWAPGVPHVIQKELCFRIELRAEPRDTIVRREEQCPPLAPSVRPTPSA